MPPPSDHGDHALAPQGVMEKTKFFEHYRIFIREDGSPQEVRRSGAAIHYKSIDVRTGQPVMLQLIPISTVSEAKREQFEERTRTVQKLDHINVARVVDVASDDEHIGVVSEYLDGETTDAWLAAHGAMPADAVLRIGLQVVRALAAAAFHRLAHQAIQPSNIMIVPGQSPDGGWPLIKLLNFGQSGLDIYSPGSDTREISSSGAPQFASPEQLLDRPLDFRSEIYSLGATMCFLLTGAVPLAASAMKVRLRTRRLPELRRAPRALRNLLVHMLQEVPEDRPQDPVAFETEMLDCLTTIERRQNLGRKLGIPMAAVVPRKPGAALAANPFRQVVRGTVAFAALLLVAGILAALFVPEDKVPFFHRREKQIGVEVGVPEKPAAAVVAANVPTPLPAQNISSPPASSPTPLNVPIAQTTSVPSEAPASTPPQIAAAEVNESPEPPAEAPEDESSKASEPPRSQKSEIAQTKSDAETATADKSFDPNDEAKDSLDASSNISPAKKKTPDLASSRRSTSLSASKPRLAQAPTHVRHGPILQFPDGTPMRAHVVRTLPDGRVILRLPSGRTVLAVPGPSRNVPPPQYSRRMIQRDDSRPADAPYQPFDSGDPNN